jgi:hypothetical protein
VYLLLGWRCRGVTVDVQHCWAYGCAFRAMRKKLKLNFDVGDCGSKKLKRRYGGACGDVCVFSGRLESGGRFCHGVFGRNLAAVAVKMFSHLLHKKLL